MDQSDMYLLVDMFMVAVLATGCALYARKMFEHLKASVQMDGIQRQRFAGSEFRLELLLGLIIFAGVAELSIPVQIILHKYTGSYWLSVLLPSLAIGAVGGNRLDVVKKKWKDYKKL